MSEQERVVSIEPGPTIQSIVDQWHLNQEPPEVLVTRLIEREQAMAEALLTIGNGLDLHIELVAEVLAGLEMGRPKTPEERRYIHMQVHALQDRLRAEGDHDH